MIGLIIGIVSIVTWLIWSNAFYQVKEGFALIRWGVGGDKVYFRGSFFAYPLVHRVEKINIKEQRVLISLIGEQSVLTQDNIRVELQLTFFVQIQHTNWDVLQVARTYGGTGAVEKETLKQIFEPTFVHEIKTLVKQYTYQRLDSTPQQFLKELKYQLEVDFGGYQLNRIRIAALKYLPLDEYDIDHNALDAEGYKNLKEWLNQNKKAS
ncbi:SPFH domain-containing protein [Aureispira sp. CCB-QB1]|uniref:SPFH domain-containing protein n=1 Tax=Aureispira sp. CCB-QB1 TaxID=1313421 RepID=UPI000698A85D|nr:SPFH domain-containing protein [Aureispira sp. CCB-QB1]